MSNFSTFALWYQTTRERQLGSPNAKLINDATKHTYTIGKMVKGRPEKVIQGGSYITERVLLSVQNTFRTYNPGETRNPTRSGTAVEIKWPWRFTEANTSVTDAEQMTNEGSELNRWKKLADALDQQLYTDCFNGMETALWARPDEAEMTRMNTTPASPGALYSIPAFITETALRPPGWTGDVGGASPTTYSNWDNQRESFSAAAPYGDDGIFANFDKMLMLLQWEQGFSRQQYVESDDLNRLMIFTNMDGRAMFMNGLRTGNDSTRAGPQDPAYGKPVFSGIPIDWASELENAQLSESGGSYENKVYDAGEPRFYFVNANYLYPVFHSDRYMKRKVVAGGVQQHDTETVFCNTWYNLVCTSRRRQGIVFPA